MAPGDQVNDRKSLLVQLCIKVLKERASGMTTKEMAAALDNEKRDGFNGISSSILSSKLNAVFRRCRNISRNPDTELLDELPLSRAQSTELPRRLVYQYTVAPEHQAETRNPDTGKAESIPDVDSIDDVKATSSPTEQARLKRSSSMSSEGLDVGLSDEESSSNGTNTPLTPKEESNQSAWPAAKRPRLNPEIVNTPQTLRADIPRSTTPPNAHKEAISTRQYSPSKPITHAAESGTQDADKKAPISPQSPKFNLYYDIVGFEAVTAALDCGDIALPDSQASKLRQNSVESDRWFEYISPETFALNELDQLIS